MSARSRATRRSSAPWSAWPARGRQREPPHTALLDRGQIAPRGLTRALERLAGLRVPIYVTENGVLDGADSVRPEYLIDHVAAVHAAIAAGAEVRGYFH